MFIDTHCHLDATEFKGLQEAIVRGAQAAGVAALVLPSIGRDNFEDVQTLSIRYPNCAPAYGIHPLYTNHAKPADLELLRCYLAKQSAIAVGEIGLDFFVAEYDQKSQEYYFLEQLKLAREFDLPVLLHSRRAQDLVLKQLRMCRVRGGIAHAFNGSAQQAAEFIKLGFKLGFGGAMTHSRATRLRQLAASIPLHNIVLETDAPDIPPNFVLPGSPNKPEFLPRIAQTLADLRGVTLAEIERITTENVLSAIPKLLPFLISH
jgi:TatD DNase family protein